MSPRSFPSRKDAPIKPVQKLEVGDLDPMSIAAVMARVPLCGTSKHGREGCTRAAGHHETIRHNPSARQHVSTTPGFVVKEILK